LTSYGSQVAIKIVPVSKTVGPNQPNSPQTEAELDIQFIATVNDEAANWFWLEAGDNWLYLFSVHFMNTATVPMVNSISYAWSEMDQCQINPSECQNLGVNSQGYVTRVNAEFQKIAIRGITLLSASGDSGANGRTDEYCSLKYLKPAFPACSPYITSVGATQVNTPTYSLASPPPLCKTGEWACISGGTEVAVSHAVSEFTSGGGFSDYAQQPSYQTAAVKAYFSSGVTLPPASYYNATGRGYPDVAALGHNCMIYSGGVEAVGGTSCATPAFAAVVSLLNQAQIAKTTKPLGFLNPFLYQMYAAQPNTFNDITVGDNKCTESGCSPGCQGFYAYKGWDAVSGLGSPNVKNMLAYINAQD
jgi:tripeptidyl-peptidase-1